MGSCQTVEHIRFSGHDSTVAAVHRCTALHIDRKLLFLLCFCQQACRQRTWNIDSQLSKGGNTADFRHEPEMTVPRLPTQFPVSLLLNRSPSAASPAAVNRPINKPFFASLLRRKVQLEHLYCQMQRIASGFSERITLNCNTHFFITFTYDVVLKKMFALLRVVCNRPYSDGENKLQCWGWKTHYP